jgi:hypothetical protein
MILSIPHICNGSQLVAYLGITLFTVGARLDGVESGIHWVYIGIEQLLQYVVITGITLLGISIYPSRIPPQFSVLPVIRDI